MHKKYTYGFICMFLWDKWKSREEASVCWWSRSYMELEHSEGQRVTLTPNSSPRDWPKLSHFNAVWHLGKCKVLIWQIFMALWDLESPKEIWASPAEHSPHQHSFYSYHSLGQHWVRTIHPPVHLWICWRSHTSILSIPAHMNLWFWSWSSKIHSKISTLSQNLLVSTAPKDNLANLTCSLTDRTSPPQLSERQGDVSEHN